MGGCHLFACRCVIKLVLLPWPVIKISPAGASCTSRIHSGVLAHAGGSVTKSDHVNGVVYGVIRKAHKGVVVTVYNELGRGLI